MENKELINKLEKEQFKLSEELAKLANFIIEQEDSQDISNLQLNLLNAQRDVMAAYLNVLEMRIDDLKGER